MIVAENLVKDFRVHERGPGLLGSLGTLFSREHRLVRAVSGVSFEIPAGTKVAYIGANGAGKSTTVKMLTGIMTPTSGRALVAGLEPYRERRRNAANIGVVFGQRSQLWWDLPVPDSFRILRGIHDIPDAVYRRNMALYRDLLDLDALGNTPVRQLSLGQRMRAEVAASLVHDPKVVFLDEPTVGLDLVLKEAVRELVNRVNAELGTTVLLTSHDMGDIRAICDGVLVVDRGEVVHSGSVHELLRTADTRAVLFEHEGDPAAPTEAIALIEARLDGASATVVDGGRIRVEYPTGRWTSRQVMGLLLEHFDVTDCVAPEPDLESVLRRIYTGGRRPAPRPEAVG
ncbi:ATP-binding cassette domain-containing protein [Kitasatospora sp. GP82]|uniref:ABC transporter ATP-binding protein n=1 Tax=Kitasatospora sp. GP82 TaxID=3035089 RepID=UPI002476AB1A|nr:ATP-binding cassette domain-containing protein [Kitasatospora sp. GP82]MDH6128373.1 ABC-2 type transport system ATP-binding protein [Kitasatospora sp. GP82]